VFTLQHQGPGRRLSFIKQFRKNGPFALRPSAPPDSRLMRSPRGLRKFGFTGRFPGLISLTREEEGQRSNKPEGGWVQTTLGNILGSLLSARFLGYHTVLTATPQPARLELRAAKPSGIREMLPSDIAKFQSRHYSLRNMGRHRFRCRNRRGYRGTTLASQTHPEPRSKPRGRFSFSGWQTQATLPPFEPATRGQGARHLVNIPATKHEEKKTARHHHSRWPPERFEPLTPRDETCTKNLFSTAYQSGASSKPWYRLFIQNRAQERGKYGTLRRGRACSTP